MDDLKAYDEQVQAIRDANEPIIESFQTWLEQNGLTDKTIKGHLVHICQFADYLAYYDPLKRLDQADSGDIGMFLSYWFPHKVMYNCVSSSKP
jgi:site-specific recombinase XerD